jgi:hypothetical protein
MNSLAMTEIGPRDGSQLPLVPPRFFGARR